MSEILMRLRMEVTGGAECGRTHLVSIADGDRVQVLDAHHTPIRLHVTRAGDGVLDVEMVLVVQPDGAT